MGIKAQLKQIRGEVLYREFQPIQPVEKQYICINDRSYINFTSNGYLGIGQPEYQPQNFLDFVKAYSIHLPSSRLVSGSSVVYQQLEQAISEHFNFEDALIFSSGYDASLVVFNTFKNNNVVISSDQQNHVSIVDGIKLSGLLKVIYQHLNYDDLESYLVWYTSLDVQKVIVSDSVFPTNGIKTDINRLVHLKQRYSTILIIDVSYSLESNPFEHHADIGIVTSSLPKAWGAHGGAMFSSKDIKDLIINKGCSLIYSGSLPNYHLYSIQVSLQHVIEDTYRRGKLNVFSEYFNHQPMKLFLDQSLSNTLIKNIVCDSLASAQAQYNMLFEYGIFVSYLRYPTVLQPILRIPLSYFHDIDDIDRLFNVMKQYDEGDSCV